MSKHIAVERTLSNANPIGRYTMTLRDRNHNIIQEGTYPIHSAINQYWRILYETIISNQFRAYVNIVGTAGQNLTHLTMRAAGTGATNDARGIVVGTSSSAVALGNTSLGGFIRSGTSANQLTYSPTIITYDTSNGRITLTQTFTNDAVSTEPTVNEVGIGAQTNNAEDGLILLIRDVPGSSYAMLLGATLTVSYELLFPFGCQNHAMLFAKHQIARNTTNIELYDSNGALVTASTYGIVDGAFGFVGSLGDTTRGIIVGNGSGAEAFNTFALETQIPHGTNAGELFHYDSTHSGFELNTTIDNVCAFYLSRVFKNKSGASVDIEEIGLSSNATIGATNNQYLFDRRVLGSPVSVADNESVTITWAYKYKFT